MQILKLMKVYQQWFMQQKQVESSINQARTSIGKKDKLILLDDKSKSFKKKLKKQTIISQILPILKKFLKDKALIKKSSKQKKQHFKKSFKVQTW